MTTLFDSPMSLSEAVKILVQREIMPTSLDTAGIRQLDASLRAQSLFSAQTTDEYLLSGYKNLIGNLLGSGRGEGPLTREYNPASARAEIKAFLRRMGYKAEPGTEGTLKDLSSDARINLVVKTNTEMSQGQGWWLQGQQQPVLDAWPAQELFRAEDRKVPREWMARWTLAGGQTGDPIGTGWTVTADGRLIALKNHEIWKLIGSSSLFNDGLDQPWPPFAFNSGMWVRDVDRGTAVGIGLIGERGRVEPMTLDQALRN